LWHDCVDAVAASPLPQAPGVKDNAINLIPAGCYQKDDGGVNFTIGGDSTFTYKGKVQKIRVARDAGGRPSFSVNWEWGEPTFVLQADEMTLVEDGKYSFRLVGASSSKKGKSPADAQAIAPLPKKQKVGGSTGM
jgi:hypothetical protein